MCSRSARLTPTLARLEQLSLAPKPVQPAQLRSTRQPCSIGTAPLGARQLLPGWNNFRSPAPKPVRLAQPRSTRANRWPVGAASLDPHQRLSGWHSTARPTPTVARLEQLSRAHAKTCPTGPTPLDSRQPLLNWHSPLGPRRLLVSWRTQLGPPQRSAGWRSFAWPAPALGRLAQSRAARGGPRLGGQWRQPPSRPESVRTHSVVPSGWWRNSQAA